MFDPYHDTESNIPPFLQQLVETQAPPLRLVQQPEDWCHEQLEGCDLSVASARSGGYEVVPAALLRCSPPPL